MSARLALGLLGMATLGVAVAQVPARLSPTCPSEKAGSVLVCQGDGAAGWSPAPRERYVTLSAPYAMSSEAATSRTQALTTPLSLNKTWTTTVPIDGVLQSVRLTCNNWIYQHPSIGIDVRRGSTSLLVEPLVLPLYESPSLTTTAIADSNVVALEALTIVLSTYNNVSNTCSVVLTYSGNFLTQVAAPPVPSTVARARLTCEVPPTLSALELDVLGAAAWGETPSSLFVAPLSLPAGARVAETDALAQSALAAGQPLMLQLSARDTGQTASGCAVNLTVLQGDTEETP